MTKDKKRALKLAAQAHTDLNIFAAIVALLESGCVYGGSAAAVRRITKICQKEQQRQLRIYDDQTVKALGG